MFTILYVMIPLYFIIFENFTRENICNNPNTCHYSNIFIDACFIKHSLITAYFHFEKGSTDEIQVNITVFCNIKIYYSIMVLLI